jgi:hypothetical protein
MYPKDYTTGDEHGDCAPDTRYDRPCIPFEYTTGDEGGDCAPDGRYEHVTESSKYTNRINMDWMLHQAMHSYEDEEWDDGPVRPKVPEGHWKMKDGNFIEIKKMTDDHLNNAIAMCERKGIYGIKQPLVAEKKRRKDILEKYKIQKDPIYAAFVAGWNASEKSAYDTAYPDVGFSIHRSKESAWKEYNKSK